MELEDIIYYGLKKFENISNKYPSIFTIYKN